MPSTQFIVEYRRSRAAGRAPEFRGRDDPPPRPGGVPLRLGRAIARLDARGVEDRRGRIRGWRAA
jgi:hypothetical protein